MDDNYNCESIQYLNAVESLKFDHITVMLEKTDHETGFGLAVSGGKDNAYERGGDTSIVVSDVVPGSAADSLVRVNDIVIAINGINVENVNHSYAVHLLRSMKKNVYLLLKRRKHELVMQQPCERKSKKENVGMMVCPKPQFQAENQVLSNRTVKNIPKESRNPLDCDEVKYTTPPNCINDFEEMTLILKKNRNGYGLYLGNLIFVKDKIEGSPAYRSDISIGDIIRKINDVPLESCKSTDEVLDLIKRSGKEIKLDILRPKNAWLPHPLTSKTYIYEEPEDNKRDLKKRPKSSSFKVKDVPMKEPDNRFTQKVPQVSKRNRSLSSEVRDDSNRIPYQRSYSTTKFTRDEEEVIEPQSSRYSKAEEYYPPEQMIPIISDVHRRNYGRPRSDSTNAALSQCRTLHLSKTGDQLGLQVVGGNKSGIFISSILENGSAELCGLRVGDLIVMVNDVDFRHLTREEAVMVLLSFKHQKMVVKCISKLPTFEKIRFQPGDDFYVRVNFDYIFPTNARELSLKKGELLHVRDTMYGGTIGSWSARRISLDGKSGETGVVPNRNRAEQLASKFKLEEKKHKEGKRRMIRASSRSNPMNTRTEYQSQDKLDSKSFSDQSLELPAYQTVVKSQSNFRRPVVLIGAASDVFREFLLSQYNDDFALPTDKTFDEKRGGESIKLYQIKSVIEMDKHTLLDVSPEAIQLLHHVNLSPIVILIKLANRKFAREFRTAAVNMVYGSSKDPVGQKEARNIYRYAFKIEKKYPMLITAILEVFDQTVDSVFFEIIDIIKARQKDPIFTSELNIDQEFNDDVAFRGPTYASGFSSANESCTDEDYQSVASIHAQDDEKVFRGNKYDANRKAQSNKNHYIAAEPVQSGRKIDVEYQNDQEEKSKSRKSGGMTTLKSSLSSFGNRRKTISGIPTSHMENLENKNIELSLSTVLKVKSDRKGGSAECPSTRVSVYLPPGACNSQQEYKELFFKVYVPTDSKSNPNLSNCPFIVCGPAGTSFDRPIEIRIPNIEDSQIKLDMRMKTCKNVDDSPTEWIPLPLDYPGAAGNSFKLSSDTTAVLVDRF